MGRKGFSLPETTLTILLVSVLILGGGLTLMRVSPKFYLERGAWEVQARLNQARYKAIFKGVDVRVTFRPESCFIERYDAGTKSWRREGESVFEGVAVEANNRPVFHPVGTVSGLASIEVWNSYGKYRITLAISGRIKSVRIS